MSLTTILKTAPSRLPQYEELDLSDNVMYPQQVRPIVRDIKLVNFYGNEQVIKTGRGPRFRIRYDQITSAQLSQIEKWEQGRIPVTFNGNYDASTWLLFNFFRAGRDAVTLAPLIERTKDKFVWAYDRTTTNSNASYILDDLNEPGHEYVADDVPRFAEGWKGFPGIICESYTQQLTAPSHPDTGDNVWVGASGSPVLQLGSSDSHYTGMAKALYVAMADTEAIEWQSPIYSAWAGANITDTDCTFSVYIKGEGTVRLQANNSLVTSPPVNGPATVLTGKWQRLVLERIFINKVAGNRLDIEIQNNSGSYVWFRVGGAQLEQGRPVTSYLHTVGSTDPIRTGDRISATSGAAPLAQEGTMFAGLTHPQDTYVYDTGSPAGGVYASEYLLFNQSTHPNFFGIAWRPSQKKWSFTRINNSISQASASTKSPGDDTVIAAAWRDNDEWALYEDATQVAQASITYRLAANVGVFYIGSGGWSSPEYIIGISTPEQGAGLLSWLRWDTMMKSQAEVEAINAQLADADQMRWNAQFWGREFAVEGFSRNINPVAHGRYSGRFELIQTSAHYQSTPREP